MNLVTELDYISAVIPHPAIPAAALSDGPERQGNTAVLWGVEDNQNVPAIGTTCCHLLFVDEQDIRYRTTSESVAINRADSNRPLPDTSSCSGKLRERR